MAEPYISITMTCYNYAHYMKRSLNAIKNQTYKDYDVILIDDCSKDDTVSVIKKFMNENPDMPIRLIENKENQGVLAARNTVLDAADGTYIMFCDSDDWMDENCLEVLAKGTNNGEADRVIAQFRDVDQSGKILQIQDLPEKPSKWICGCHHGTLYRRSIFVDHDIRFKDLYPDDVYINVMFHQYCNKVVFLHETIYNWYVHTDSTSRTLNEDSPWIGVKMFQQVLDYVTPIFEKLESQKEKQEVELLVMKLYCLSIYHSYRDTSLKKMFKGYRKLHGLMKKYYPRYQKNIFLSSAKDAPMRKYALLVVKGTVYLEKFHLMKIGLTAYHIISKFYYFNM